MDKYKPHEDESKPAARESNNTFKIKSLASRADKMTEHDEEQQPLVKKYKLYPRRWLVLLIYSVVIFMNEALWINLSSITSIVKVYYGVNSNAVNWLSEIFFALFVFVVAALYILNKYGLKVTIITGAVLNGLGSCLRLIGANRDGFLLVFIGNIFGSFGQCFLLFIPPKLAAVWFGENERATASSIGVLLNMFGIAGGFLLGMMVPNSKNIEIDVHDGMVNQLVVQAIVCTILVVCAVLFIKDAPPTPPSKSQELVLMLQNKDKMQAVLKGDEEWNQCCSGLFIEDRKNPMDDPRTHTDDSKLDEERGKVNNGFVDEDHNLIMKDKNEELHVKKSFFVKAKDHGAGEQNIPLRGNDTKHGYGTLQPVKDSLKKPKKEESVQMTIYLLSGRDFKVKFSKDGDVFGNDQKSVEIFKKENMLKKVVVIDKMPNLRESLWMLMTDKSFHLLFQAYSIYYGLNSGYNTILNEMITSKYAGKEKEIGYIGFISNSLGVLAMLFSGISLDRTKRYKRLSLWTFGACFILMLLFTLVLSYDNHFFVMFIIFCVFSTFSYPFLSAGLEYAAEITYPISEGTTSCILLLGANLYSILVTELLWYANKKGGGHVAGYIMLVLYALCWLLTFLVTAPLKRSEAEKPTSIDSDYSPL
eukprot:gene9019-9983_t